MTSRPARRPGSWDLLHQPPPRRDGCERLRDFSIACAAWSTCLILAALVLTPIPACAVPPSSPGLVIQEVASANQSGLRDEEGDRPDWVELHNPGTEAVDLAGWSLSDEAGKPRKWTFSTGSIPPAGYLVLFASGKDRQPAPAAPIAPVELPGLVSWLRASAIDPSNPIHVRRSGNADFVRFWPDASALGRPARQDQADAQPRLIQGAVPAVRFDGINDLLRFTAPAASNHFTLLAVFHPLRGHEIDPVSSSSVGGTSGQAWLLGAAHGGDAGAGMGLSVGTNGVSLYEHGSSYMPAVSVSQQPLTTTWNVASVRYTDRRPTLSVNGTAVTPGARSPRNPVTAPVELGSGSYGAFAGDIAELLVFDRALDIAEWRGLEAHLLARYAIPSAASFHTNFRISAGGERLVLTRPDGSRADDVRVPATPRDVSWGRLSNAAATWRFFASPTPGSPNPEHGAVSFLAPPHFSVPAGFHAAALSVALTTQDANAELRFTLDGSEPTQASPLYSGPLVITNRSSLPNRLAAIPTAPGWNPPLGRVFKGTVVRARAFRADALPSDTVTATYFVHPAGRARYSLPVVSLATEERHFFSADTGIYVPGNAPGGNYSQTGDAWERPVHVELFETNGTRPIAQESGVRMHGNTSFGFPIKALRLHPLNQRGTGPFRHRIFPDLPVESFNRLLLRPSGHDHHLTMMRDGLMQGLVRELDLETQGYRPAILFINGEYWGLHNLQEAFEKGYFASHHPGVDADAVDYLEGYAPGAFAYEGDATQYHDLIQRLEAHSPEDPGVFDWVQSRMEIPNYRDYKLAELFYYRWDIGNHRLWRPRTPDGRLRWILFDCDVGFGGFWSEPNPWTFDMLRAILEPSGTLHGHNNATTVFLLGRLLENPGFRSDFINRAADLMNVTLSTERMLGFIDRMAGEIAPEMVEHIQRWRAPASYADWQRNVSALRTFARERPRHVREHFLQRFGLPGTAEITLKEPGPGSGTLRVNSLQSLRYSGGAWKGVYFRGHPIELHATPAPGFLFAGWEEFPGLTRNPLPLNLAGDFTFTPRFVPALGPRLDVFPDRLNGSLALTFAGPPSTRFTVEACTNLTSWLPVATSVTDAVGRASVRLETSSIHRFLRVRLDP